MSDFFDSLNAVMIPLCAGPSGRSKQRPMECQVVVSTTAGYVRDACLVVPREVMRCKIGKSGRGVFGTLAKKTSKLS